MGTPWNWIFVAVAKRLDELVAWVSSKLEVPQGCCGGLDELVAIASRFEGEEKFFYILLVIHFASPRTADEFYARLDWAGLLQSDTSTIRTVSTGFFQKGHFIGDHRRYFRCLTTSDKKTKFTVEILDAYRQVMQAYGSRNDASSRRTAIRLSKCSINRCARDQALQTSAAPFRSLGRLWRKPTDSTSCRQGSSPMRMKGDHAMA